MDTGDDLVSSESVDYNYDVSNDYGANTDYGAEGGLVLFFFLIKNKKSFIVFCNKRIFSDFMDGTDIIILIVFLIISFVLGTFILAIC